MAIHTEAETVATEASAGLAVALHDLTPDQVTATDLTDHDPNGELVTTDFGPYDAQVTVYGTLQSLREIASAWLGQLDKIEVARQHAAEQSEAEATRPAIEPEAVR